MNQISFDVTSPEMAEAFTGVQPGDTIECKVVATVTGVSDTLSADVTSVEYDGYEYDFSSAPAVEAPVEPKPKGRGRDNGLVVVVQAGPKPKPNGKE